MLSLLTTFFFSALYAVAFAAPSLVKRIVVDPPITSPDASTVWTVGSSVTVTWNTTVIPPEAQNSTGTLVLGFQTSDSENLQLDDPLAKGFLLTDGSVQITVPDVEEKSNYIVVLFGDSGNASPEFTITGGSASSSSSASSSISGASTSTETVVATTATTETVPATTSTGTAVVVTAISESSLSTVLSASPTGSGSEASSASAASITTFLSTSTAEASSTASAGTAVADSTNDGLSARAHGLGMQLVVSGVAVIVAFVL